jgi:hypothetical protein
MDDQVIDTPMFCSDCRSHFFSDEERQAVRTVLAVNRRYGREIVLVRGRRGPKFDCAYLRVMEWAYSRNGRLVQAYILYAHVGDEFPVLLLRLEVNDARGKDAPFNNPVMWSRWAEVLGELIEIVLRAVT